MKRLDTYIYFHVLLTSILLIVARSGSVPTFIIYLSLGLSFTLILIRIYFEKKYSSNLKKNKRSSPKKDSLKK